MRDQVAAFDVSGACRERIVREVEQPRRVREPAGRFDFRIVRAFERTGNVVHARRSFAFDHRRRERQSKELSRRVFEARTTTKKIGEVVTGIRRKVKPTGVF